MTNPAPTYRRKALSKKTRFDVFKRDLFTCQYCGAHPPGVLLHVDHVLAVATGGTNAVDNLVTACEPCNLGKGARSLSVAPQTLSDKAKLIAEREAQLFGYQEILEAKRSREEDEMWRVAEVLEPGSGERGMHRSWLGSISRFNRMLGVHEVLAAADLSRVKFPSGGRSALLYFCGICWKCIRTGSAVNA